jgi:pimeloyl-ACP methyl ester carboxylesterase
VKTRIVKANGFNFAVDEAGEGDRLALCLHGFPESRFSWRYQLPMLAQQNYRAWAPDLRGYGGTEPKPKAISAYLVDQLMEDVEALIEASGAKSVTLIGHDWGGAVAWTFAAKRERRRPAAPLERLVIMNAPHPAVMNHHLHWNPVQLARSMYIFFFQLPWLPEWVMTTNDAQVIRRAFLDMAIDHKHFTREVLDRYAQDAQRPDAIRGMVNWYRAAFRLRSKLAKPWPIIETPTLVIWGREDRALGGELLRGLNKYVRNLAVRRLPHVSHWVQQEAPDAVNAILAEWLTAPRGSPAGAG